MDLPVPVIQRDPSLRLHPHQIDGVKWLMSLVQNPPNGQCPGGILADDMGLGKTIQIAAFLDQWNCIRLRQMYERTTHHCGQTVPQKLTILLIVPLSLIPTWEQELSKWFVLSIHFHSIALF